MLHAPDPKSEEERGRETGGEEGKRVR